MPKATIDPSYFNDVADALNINETAFVEKDYYAVQLLKLIGELEHAHVNLIFSGGTCLSKAYQNTQRMSEDIDIKISNRNLKPIKAHRRDLNQLIVNTIENCDCFSIKRKQIHNQYQAQLFEIEYPISFTHSALKPSLKLELVQSVIYNPIHKKSIRSIYNQVMKQPAEIKSIDCVNIESIISEKLIALLWRSSALALGKDIENDPALVRHAYDIHISLDTKEFPLNLALMSEISKKSLADHAKRYHNKHPEFSKTPKNALRHGLEIIESDSGYRHRYEQFLLPLLYAKNPPTWDDALNSVKNLYQTLHES